MSRYVKVSAVSFPDYFTPSGTGGPEEWVSQVTQMLDACMEPVLPEQPDLIVFPEVCDRVIHVPLEQRLAYFEARGERILHHFEEAARRYHCNIAYPYDRRIAPGRYYNSLRLINRDGGTDGIYNKNYVVPNEFEEGYLMYGADAPVIRTDFGKAAGVICFDLNFEELRNRYRDQKPELLIFSSMFHGGVLQQVWATVCRCFLVGSVRGLPCTVVDPLGRVVASSTNYSRYVTSVINLDYELVHLDHHAAKLRAAKEKYKTGIKITDPGHMAYVMLSSESEDVTAAQVLEEFEIEPLDRYLERAARLRQSNL